MILLMDRQKLHTAIEERGLDPLLGYTLERYFSDVQGLSGTESQRYCVPIAPGSDGMDFLSPPSPAHHRSCSPH